MPDKITFHYKVSPNYALYKISGAHGGIGAQGDIIANFYSERHPIPKSVTHELKENGTLGEPPIDIEKKEGVIRDVLFGFSLSAQNARSIGEWLIKMADEFEKLQLEFKEQK